MSYYQDRHEAGKVLAKALQEYSEQTNTIILALPRGGVPVAYPVAKKLQLPMDIFLVRKLGVPGHEELAFGALAEDDVCIFNEDVVSELHLSKLQIQKVMQQESQELARRQQYYRQGRHLPSLKHKTVILIDDGIATGASIKAAITALKKFQPAQVIIAIPVASRGSIQGILPLVDKVICPLLPDYFYGVGQWYQSFVQTKDEEVINLLHDSTIS